MNLSHFYDVIVWFEPHELFFGQQIPNETGDDRVHFLYGNRWEGHHPTDFTHLRVVLLGYSINFDPPYCFNTYEIPVVWEGGAVPTAKSSWGGVKSKYKPE